MDTEFSEPIKLAEGINLRDLLSGPREVKLDFKKKKDIFADSDDDMLCGSDEDESSSEEDVLGHIEEMVDKALLSSPEYQSFDDLAKRMTDCMSPTGGVKILILEEGTGPLISMDVEVTYHYAAYWEGAKLPFDSTLSAKDGKPLRHRVGLDMLPGVAFGFLSVRGPSARFHLLLEPHVAYMNSGAQPRIRKNERVLFVMSLYDVRTVHAAARFNDLPKAVQAKFDVAMNAIKDIRIEAKDLFARHKYKRAIKCYEQGISILTTTVPENDQQKTELRDIRVKIYVNLIVCYYKIEKPKHIISMCENIDRYIDINKHCKALFYFGRAYELLGKADDAINYYKKALKLEPNNKEIGKTLAEIDGKRKLSATNEKTMWQKAFNSDAELKVSYDVDDDFKDSVFDTCQDLAGRSEYSKIDLPNGLTKAEVDCIKSLTGQFKGLIVSENGEGKRKKVSIIKM